MTRETHGGSRKEVLADPHWDWMQNGSLAFAEQRPLNEIEWLMTHSSDETMDDIEPLRDAVSMALLVLTDEEQMIVDGVWLEKCGWREMRRRLGHTDADTGEFVSMANGTFSRLLEDIRKKLQQVLLKDEVIQRRYPRINTEETT